MKQIFLYIIGVVIFIIVVGLLVKNNKITGVGIPAPTSTSALPSTNLKTISVGGTSIKVAVAKSEDEKRKGLSGVSLMAQDQGMIFDYKDQGLRPAFWMKDMLFPLDFIWIKAGKVIEVTTNVSQPVPGTRDADLKIYLPKESVDYILEVNSGFVGKNNIKVGTTVDTSQL
ncbi:MAG TPA: DUF192 domain-containing protein [Patescibacteria group bacterium]